MPKFVKKPVVIDAFIWTGDIEQAEDPRWIREAMNKNDVWVTKSNATCQLAIRTLEGVMLANQGDYIIRGIMGEIYPCKPGIFIATYDRVSGIAVRAAPVLYPHAWRESQTGHGVVQCGHCLATMSELRAIGKINHCQARKDKYMRTEI